MNGTVVFAKRVDDKMLRLIFYEPFVDRETRQYFDGAVGFEIVEVIDVDGTEEYGEAVEIMLTMDVVAYLVVILNTLLVEGFEKTRFVVLENIVEDAFKRARTDDDKRYIG